MNKVRVGVVGLGEVWQTVHMPIFRELSDLFEVVAICDVSPTLLSVFGDQLGLGEADRFDDYRLLAQHPKVDLVMVLNSSEYHADTALAAINAGKHTFIEKPMAMTLAEADALAQERDAAGVQVMVGYMRRFAPAFEEAVRQVPSLGPLQYGRVRAIIGPNATFIGQSNAVVVRPNDYPQEAIDDRLARASRQVTEALGDAPDDLQASYRHMGGLSSHDLSAMRELIGMPSRVISATHWNGGRAIHAVLDYGSYPVSFETLVDQQPRFDAHIELFGATKSIRIQYDTPYLRHLPTELHVSEASGHQLTRSVIRPTFTDPYTFELRHVHAVVNGLEQPKTTIEDSREDLVLFGWIADAIRASNAKPSS